MTIIRASLVFPKNADVLEAIERTCWSSGLSIQAGKGQRL